MKYNQPTYMQKEKQSNNDNKIDADFVHKITSLLMQQVRAYEEQISILQKERDELKAKLDIISNTPLDQIQITVS